jgi:hypothetical protein
MLVNRIVFFSGVLSVAATGLRAEAPLSAIDWLSKSVATPVAMPAPDAGANMRTPVTTSTPPEPISVAPLDRPTLDGLGLLPVSKTGLPRNLWGTTPTRDIVRLLQSERVDTLPAMQSLLLTLLLAELTPPADADGAGQLFLARVDKLLDLGSLEPALAMLELPEHPQPEPFRRWFDVALLLGQEDRACEVMSASPEIAPTFPARIFCLARQGDWNAAALSLRTGEVLGYIDGDMARLLERFLEPELAEEAEDLPPPERPSPLVLRLMEAIGQPLPTATLPVAFANADLRSNSGWKTRLEAGERLARLGSLEPNRLLGLYTEQQPAASGGVWDRVAAIRKFDAAYTARDPEALRATIFVAWDAMVKAELEVWFAEIYGAGLAEMKLPGEAGALAFRIGLLSDAYETVAQMRTPQGRDEPYLIGLATGVVSGIAPPDQMGAAIQAAFSDAAPAEPDKFAPLLAEKRLGEAMLMAIENVTEGARGELRDVTSGLRLFRQVGLESVARRAALELVLLERRG